MHRQTSHKSEYHHHSDHADHPAHYLEHGDKAGHSNKLEPSPVHHHDHGMYLRQKSSKALWSSLVILMVVFSIEIIGGVLTHSLALLSDAAHLLTDVAAIGLALFAQWFAQKPPSAQHSFGYRRVEILAALLNGITLILVAVYIVVEAWRRMHQPPTVLGLPMLLIATFGFFAQLAITMVLHRVKKESLNVQGAYLHALTDAIQSLGVIGAGVTILLTHQFIVDPIVSALIGMLIAYSGGKIIFEATHVLIEGTPREVNLSRVANLIQGTPGVLRVTDLHAWSLTSGYNALSAHIIAVPTSEDPGHAVLRGRITTDLCSHFPIQHVTLQFEEECEQCNNSRCGNWLNDANGAPNENKIKD